MAPKRQPTKRIRQRSPDSSEDENGSVRPETSEVSIHDVLELRRLKKRGQTHGIDAEALNKGDPLLLRQREEAEKARVKAAQEDPWKLKSGGGIVDLEAVRGRSMAFGHEDAAAPIGAASFTKASNTMDTEKKMQEYIESELQRRRTAGIQRVESTSNDSLDSAESKGEAAAGPDFGIEQKPVAEGNVSFSAAMLTSIPVVDLGISTKLKNIEETEKAKREIMDRKKETRDNIDKIGGSLNFAASDRYYKNKPHPHDKKKKEAEDGDKRRREEPGKPKFDRRTMATDDLVMEKFKKRNQGGRR